MSLSMKYGKIDTSQDKTVGGGGGSSNIVTASATASTLPEGSSATASASFNTSTQNLALTFGIPKGDTGAQGPTGPQGPTGATGAGVPTGGSTGQFLRKKSGTNYDTEWVNGASAYSETVLFDSDLSASATGKTLTQSLSNFKQIVVDARLHNSSTVSAGTARHAIKTIPVSLINYSEAIRVDSIVAAGSSTSTVTLNIQFKSATTFDATITATTFKMSHLKIIGIKY